MGVTVLPVGNEVTLIRDLVLVWVVDTARHRPVHSGQSSNVNGSLISATLIVVNDK